MKGQFKRESIADSVTQKRAGSALTALRPGFWWIQHRRDTMKQSAFGNRARQTLHVRLLLCTPKLLVGPKLTVPPRQAFHRPLEGDVETQL